jgi:two-component system response regulator RegA
MGNPASISSPLVVLTGYASIQTAVSALRLGAVHYLPKPANVADIVKALLEDEPTVEPLETATRMSVRGMEWEYIQRTLAEHGNNIAATARALNMHRRTLQRKLAKRRPPESL